MALWQFMILTVLIGALLVYTKVIAHRLGCADARLNRIEDALRALGRSIDSVDTRAAGSSSGQVGRGGHLTIGDLRQLSARATRSSGRIGLENDAVEISSQPLSPVTMDAVSGDYTATTLESRDPEATNAVQQSSPGYRPSEDSVAKKNRDMALFLNNQRRRRRARLGY